MFTKKKNEKNKFAIFQWMMQASKKMLGRAEDEGEENERSAGARFCESGRNE